MSDLDLARRLRALWWPARLQLLKSATAFAGAKKGAGAVLRRRYWRSRLTREWLCDCGEASVIGPYRVHPPTCSLFAGGAS